jgi:hypothetical protein
MDSMNLRRQKKVFLALLILLIALPLTVLLSRQRQENRQRAADTTPFSPFIEGFEQGNLTGWTPVTETGTSVTVTQAAAMTGTYGLHVAVPGGDDGRITKSFPNSPQLYTRIRMKILQDITPRFGQQFFMIGQGGYTGGVSLHLRSDNGYINRLQGYDPGGQLFDTGISLTANQWYTFEVYIEPGLQGKLQVWMNGAATPIVDRAGNWTSTPLSLIGIGSDGGSSGNEYYFDDFAMSNATKIGTDTPQFGIGPLRTDGAPTGGLAETTTSTQLSLKTASSATCKYGTTNNIDFDQYQNTFSQTGGTTHTQTVSNLVKGNSYKYYVRCKDTSGVKNQDDYLIYFTIPFGSLQIDSDSSVTLIPNYQTMSVYAKFVGDANKNASAQIFYRQTGSTTWKKGMKMTPERRENIPVEFTNQFKASIFGLQPKINYEVQVRFDDPDGVNGSPQQFTVTKSIATRDDNPPLGTIQTIPATGTTISTSGSTTNWITYMPPANSTVEITGTINIRADYIRIKGFNFSGQGNIVIASTTSNVIIENNTFVTNRNVIREGGAYSGTSATSENITIQNNSFTIPAGTTQAAKFIDFVNNTKGGHVMRFNTFKDLSGTPRVSGQYWDCIGGAPNFSIYGFVHRDSDINDNYFEGCNDDQLESDGGNMNVRIWNNTFNGGLNSLQVMSVDPTLLGPLYVVRNVTYGEHRSAFSKLGSDSFGHIYFFHNTHYTQNSGQGFAYANPGLQRVTTRNNIMQATRYVIELTEGGSTHSFDYDNLFTTDTTRFAKWDGNSTYNTLTKLQTIIQQTDGYGNNIASQNIGQEKNGYNYDLVTDRTNGFMNPAQNDLRLLSTSTLIDKGVIIDGINNADSPWPYTGAGPDIGKYEVGGSTNPTFTPTPTIPNTNPTNTPLPTRTPTASPTRTPTPTIAACRAIGEFCGTDASSCCSGRCNGGFCAVNTSLTPTRTPTPPAGNTVFQISLKLHGIGTGGDSVNPSSVGNMNPLTPSRTITMQVLNALAQPVLTKDGQVVFNPQSGIFSGAVDMGNTLQDGAYLVTVKSPQYLTRSIPGIQLISAGQAYPIQGTVSLITGDVNNDNILNILDFNLISDCYSDLAPARNCTDPTKKQQTDITDDGSVNQFDYNLFIRELSVRSGA